MNNYIEESRETAPDYEKLSYGKIGYKRVQRLRRKGKIRGIEIPPLNYELTKPEKPRIAFWIVAIVSAVLFAGVIVGIGILYNELIKTFSDLGGLGDLIAVMFQPEVLGVSLGISALSGLMLVMIYVLISVLFVIPLIAAIYFYQFVRDAFYMAKCSKEEFAKGGIISARIFRLIVVLAIATVLFIYGLSSISEDAAIVKILLGVVYGGVVITFGGLLALMIVEKTKCAKWFESLEEDKKQNYLAHEKALQSVKGRLNRESRMFSNFR